MIVIRGSMLSSYPDCPRRGFAAQYWKLVESAGFTLRQTRPSIGAAVGTGVHAGGEYGLTLKMRGERASVQDEVEIAINAMRGEMRDGVVYDHETTSPNDAESQVRVLVNSYHEEIIPIINPLRLEVQREAMVSPTIKLTGRTDIETVEHLIYDVKAGSKESPHYGQFGGYSLLKKAHGEPVAGIRSAYLQRTKKTYPGAKVIPYDIATCEQTAYAVTAQIARDHIQFERSGNPLVIAANPMSNMCSEKYCKAWGTTFCQLGRKT